MSKPTIKQTRDCYKRIRFHLYHLQCALNDAHNKGVIEYPDLNYAAEAPCWAFYEMKDRIQRTTQKALAKAMENEILKKLKGVY